MSLIYIKHPLEDIQKNQENFLASLAEEKQRIYHALLFNYGNAAYRYHAVEPTKEEYLQWLEGLPENIRVNFEKEGFEKSKTAFPLTRFAQEIRDNGMDEYMKNLLKPEDYEQMRERQTKFEQ